MQAYSGIFIHIQANSNIIRHIRELSKNIQAHSGPCCIPKTGIFRTLTYSENWYIQSHGIFRILVYSEPWNIQKAGIFRTLLYLEPWYIQNRGTFKSRAIFRTLKYSEPRAYSQLFQTSAREYYKNNANSFLHHFQVWQIATLSRPVSIRSN